MHVSEWKCPIIGGEFISEQIVGNECVNVVFSFTNNKRFRVKSGFPGTKRGKGKDFSKKKEATTGARF